MAEDESYFRVVLGVQTGVYCPQPSMAKIAFQVRFTSLIDVDVLPYCDMA